MSQKVDFGFLDPFDYLVWKDVDALDFDTREIEIDILLNSEQISEFKSVLVKNNYIESRVVVPKYSNEIFHMTHFTGTGYICFHVYTSLMAGSHFSKEYSIALPSNIWDKFYFYLGLKVLNERERKILSKVRCLTKERSMFSEKIKTEDLLNSKVIFDEDVCSFFCLNNISDLYDKRYKNWFVIVAENIFYKFFIRLYMKKYLSNKRLVKGRAIAFVGADGSGKSTLSDATFKLMRKKLPAAKVYLGSNFKNFSILTWLSFVLYLIFFRFFKKIGLPSVTMFGLGLYELSRQNDIMKRYRTSKKLVREGVVVIYDRLPIPGFLDFPEINSLHSIFYKRFLVIRKYWLKQMYLVDVNLISTDIDNIISRRKPGVEELEDIKKKKLVEDKFIRENLKKPFTLILNNNSLDDALNKVFSRYDA